jgi:hypothetical protein
MGAHADSWNKPDVFEQSEKLPRDGQDLDEKQAFTSEPGF